MEMNSVLQDNAVYAKEVEKLSSGELLVQAPVWTVGSARAPSELTEVPFSEVLNPPPECWSRALDELAPCPYDTKWENVVKKKKQRNIIIYCVYQMILYIIRILTLTFPLGKTAFTLVLRFTIHKPAGNVSAPMKY